ncbi:hypothetical protein [Methylobacterium trifolii]|uniref:Uncharacterized protein n=1 Tax=Methylobacterium trifolii TaxID=1003092 RepID=A0ABQ4TWI4_9HYPH|nr:hypothetical protein [Methylobacterium trifolii]GJE59620.1 hypothetical protein MPOCJGCO_1717 [Methylobacterium trifolii]
MRDDDTAGEAVLPAPVRDHLGQQLRGVLTTESDKPQFLGDDPVPDAFAPQLRKLETRLKTHEEGTGAVEDALDRILDALGVNPDGKGTQP